MTRWLWLRLSLLILAGWCGLTPARAAATNDNLQADAVYLQGQEAEERARTATTPATRQGALQQAAERYRQVVGAHPDFHDGRERLAFCLLMLLELSDSPTDQQTYIAAAGEQLDRLAADPATTADDQLRRASFLTRYRYGTATTPEAKLKAFELVREAYQAAIQQGTNTATRASAQLRLASLLVTQAGDNSPAALAASLYHEANTLFTAATQAKPDGLTPEVQNVWGVALLHVGRLDQAPATARRGLKLMEESLQGQRGDPFQRYNLACAHAVLGDRDQALGFLSGCLAEDPGHVVYQAARTDPEWAAFRESPAFIQLLQRYDPEADRLFSAALVEQSSGERATVTELRTSYLVNAYRGYVAAAKVRPDYYRAHLNALLCLRQLLSLIHQPQPRAELFAAVHEQFQAARRSAGADWPLYDTYGRILMQDELATIEDPQKQLPVLREAQGALQEGLKRVAFTADRAHVANGLATCDVFLARLVADHAERRRLLEQAIQHFEQAIQLERLASTPDVYASWGVAQLELAKLDSDRFGLRQAIERFQTTLKSDPQQLMALYNLACTYALLDQANDAMQYLAQCIQFDTEGRYVRLAATDSDLTSLRTRDDFKELLAKPAYGRPVYLNPPAAAGSSIPKPMP